MDVIGGVIARIDPQSPIWADRMRWRRARRDDVALRVVDALVQPGGRVLDVGAHRGLFSVRMRDLVGRAGAVHTFEPNPRHLPRLRAIASDGRVVVRPVALSDRNGSATLHVPVIDGTEETGLASLEDHATPVDQTLVIETMRLDDVPELPDSIDFIKCDVEGHEDAVIRGGTRVITRSLPPILVEIEQRHRKASPAAAFETLLSLGYTGWALFPTGLKPLDCFDLARDQLAFVDETHPEPIMPRGYVHNFLFAVAGTELDSLLASGGSHTLSRNRA